MKKIVALLVGILIIASFLRLQGIITNSFAFTYDAGRDLLAVQQVLHGKISLIGFTTGLPGVFYGPWWYWLLAPVAFVAHGDPQLITGFIALVGIMSVFLAFWIGKKSGLLPLGLIFATLTAVAPTLVGLSNQIWNPNIAPLWVLLSFLLIIALYKNDNGLIGNLIQWILVGFFVGMAFEAEIVFGTLFTVGILLALLISMKQFRSIAGIGGFIIGFLIMLAPRILFDVKHHFLMTHTIINTSFAKNPHGFSLPPVTQRLEFLFGVWNGSLANGNTILGGVLLVLAFILLFVGYRKALPIEKLLYNVSLIISAVFIVGLTFFSHDIWMHYVVSLPVIFILFMSLGLTIGYRYIKPTWIITLVVSIMFLINLSPIQIIQSLRQPLWEGDASVYRNQLAAIDYVYNQAQERPFKYIVYTPPVYDYPYQYLFPWYGKKKYGYVPLGEDSHPQLFFVLLEPDFQYPQRELDWLKQRQNDGKIVKDVISKGGIRIQTRVIPQ